MQTRALALAGLALFSVLTRLPAQVNEVQRLAPNVYFHEGDLTQGLSNDGWVVFEDYVLVIDGNFPAGAQIILPKIRALTDKPIRFAFNTHHHGDHAYSNQIWADQGATPVAHTGVIEEMKKYETGHYGGKPGRWEDEAKKRDDVARSKLKPPSLLFNKDLIFDDASRRVELLHFGVSHTHGDGFAWLPKEKILYTGDAVVNGPYNYVGDGDTGAWIETLEAVKKLGAQIVCPGHGAIGTGELIADQQAYFVALRQQVRKHRRKKPAQVQAAVDAIKAELQKNDRIAKYIGDFFPAQVEKVYVELGGEPFPAAAVPRHDHHQHPHVARAKKP